MKNSAARSIVTQHFHGGHGLNDNLKMWSDALKSYDDLHEESKSMGMHYYLQAIDDTLLLLQYDEKNQLFIHNSESLFTHFVSDFIFSDVSMNNQGGAFAVATHLSTRLTQWPNFWIDSPILNLIFTQPLTIVLRVLIR